jgi:hypothetical protein
MDDAPKGWHTVVVLISDATTRWLILFNRLYSSRVLIILLLFLRLSFLVLRGYWYEHTTVIIIS